MMGKPQQNYLTEFKNEFNRISKKANKNQFLTYYFIAAHPGCDQDDMNYLKEYIRTELNLHPEQVQIFTPTPSTYSTLMYYTGYEPFKKSNIFIEKNVVKKELQKNTILK